MVSFLEMESCEGVKLDELGEGEMEGVVQECERVFMVGELVEFWVGPVARAYLTDSGAPAYVKEIHGLGWYGIKMVGSFGGRNRRVHWASIFKDSTFRKEVVRLDGARVRTKARMVERAQDEADAKMGDKLRATRRELKKQENEIKEIKTQAEARLTAQGQEARQEQKHLSAGYKRDLALMRGDLDRTKQEEKRKQEELVRRVRQKTRQITKELEATQEELKDKTDMNEALGKAVKKGVDKLDGLRADGLLWKKKYVGEKAQVRMREAELIDAESQRREYEREGEGATRRSAYLVSDLRAQVEAAEGQAKVSFTALYPFVPLLIPNHLHLFRLKQSIKQG